MTQERERLRGPDIRDAPTSDPERQQMTYKLVGDLVETYPAIDAVQVAPKEAGERLLLLLSLDAEMYARPEEAWLEERRVQYDDLLRSHEPEGFRALFHRPDGLIARWQFGPTDEPPTLEEFRQSLVEADVVDRWNIEHEHEAVLQGIDFWAAMSSEFYDELTLGRFIFRRRWPCLKEVEEHLTRFVVDALGMNSFSWGTVQDRADDLGYAVNRDRIRLDATGSRVEISFDFGSLVWSD